MKVEAALDCSVGGAFLSSFLIGLVDLILRAFLVLVNVSNTRLVASVPPFLLVPFTV